MRKSRFLENEKSNDFLGLGANCLAQSCARHCAPLVDGDESGSNDPLGVPLSIRKVAALIGVSAWTIRQRYLPAGLPHFRSTPQGKLIFYKNQIISWLLAEQRKGGAIR